MKNFILLFALIIGSQTFAQGSGDVTIYSNTGNQFYVILNGIRQNDKPETNVKVTGLTNEWYDCKIMSANNNFTIEKKIIVKYDTLITYAIKEKKGKYKMRFLSETPLGTSTAVKDQSVVQYHATENPTSNTTTKVDAPARDNDVNLSTGTVTTTTTSTTTTTNTNAGVGTTTTMGTSGNETESVNVSIDIKENGMGADVNMNVSGTGTGDPNRTNTSISSDMNSSTTTSSSTTTNNGVSSSYEETTTTTTTSSGGLGTTYYEETTTTTTTTSSGNGSFGSNVSSNETTMYEDEDMTVTIDNCNISDREADEIANQVANESFSDDQTRVGNMAAENKCMSTDQIIKVANSFTFEDSKLAFLKKAYDNCTDQSNYYKVMETLTFSDDKEALQNYIDTRR